VVQLAGVLLRAFLDSAHVGELGEQKYPTKDPSSFRPVRGGVLDFLYTQCNVRNTHEQEYDLFLQVESDFINITHIESIAYIDAVTCEITFVSGEATEYQMSAQELMRLIERRLEVG